MNLCEEQVNDWKIDIISNGQQMDGSVNSNPLENCRAFCQEASGREGQNTEHGRKDCIGLNKYNIFM